MARNVFTLCALLCGLGASGKILDGTDPIVITPPDGKTGADKVFIVINGALVANTNYVDVAQAVQSASSQRLWVAIPSFLINTPNPGQIDSKISGAISAIESAGFPGQVNKSADVVVAGHSLGGIFSQGAVVKGDYAGLVLFGSYLSSAPGAGYHVYDYPKPALTLAGEVDGLTRITRIAVSLREWYQRAQTDSEAGYRYPVIALPGQSHSQFNSNQNVTSFGMKDNCAEVSWAAAHAAIGSNVAAFLTQVYGQGDLAAARRLLDEGMEYTKRLLAGYLGAQDLEASEWCGRAASAEAFNLTMHTVGFEVKTASNFVSFDAQNPSVGQDSSDPKVTAVDETEHSFNPTDLSTMALAATSIDCKFKTAEAIAAAWGQPAPAAKSNPCSVHNEKALSVALQLMTQASVDRYSRVVRKIQFDSDDVYSTGLTWQAAGTPELKESGADVRVKSARLTTSMDDGRQLCKYVSPSRLIEYIMVDGLPHFDECGRQPGSSSLVVV